MNNPFTKASKHLKPLSFKSCSSSSSFPPFQTTTQHELSYVQDDFGFNTISPQDIRPNSGIKVLKVNLLKTYKTITPSLPFSIAHQPKRILTEPSTPISNNNKDNIDNHLIIHVGDVINSAYFSYCIIDILGQGISGQVFKVIDQNKQIQAMKIIRNKKAYTQQALYEINLLQNIMMKCNTNNIVHMYDYFTYANHICIVFELLNENLYQILEHNHLQGLALSSIRYITKQILEGVAAFHNLNIIHCDLKPENILIKHSYQSELKIKVTDFGSACLTGQTSFKYIQSRYYRAPEVILGMPYSKEIDIWSIGCIVAELYMGSPLLPGTSEFDQLKKIEYMFGEIPPYLSMQGRNLMKYFKDPFKQYMWKSYSYQEYFSVNVKTPKPKYKIRYGMKCLDDLVNVPRNVIKTNVEFHNSFSSSSSRTGNEDVTAFIHFLKGLMQVDPRKRWTAAQCLRHPFITKKSMKSLDKDLYL